jgi:hypothetical protein
VSDVATLKWTWSHVRPQVDQATAQKVETALKALKAAAARADLKAARKGKRRSCLVSVATSLATGTGTGTTGVLLLPREGSRPEGGRARRLIP